MLYFNGRKPDAPTRPAERTDDHFETQVYQRADLFYTLHKDDYPDGLDWVLVENWDGSPAFELYEGQNFVAVLRILDFYKLPSGSEQWRQNATDNL